MFLIIILFCASRLCLSLFCAILLKPFTINCFHQIIVSIPNLSREQKPLDVCTDQLLFKFWIICLTHAMIDNIYIIPCIF